MTGGVGRKNVIGIGILRRSSVYSVCVWCECGYYGCENLLAGVSQTDSLHVQHGCGCGCGASVPRWVMGGCVLDGVLVRSLRVMDW